MCNHLHADLHHISLPQTCLNTLYEDTDLRVWQQNNDDFLRSIIRTINRCVPILSLLLSLSSWVNYPALENTDTLQRVRFLSRDHRLTITLLLDSEKRKKGEKNGRRSKWYSWIAIVAFLMGKKSRWRSLLRRYCTTRWQRIQFCNEIILITLLREVWNSLWRISKKCFIVSSKIAGAKLLNCNGQRTNFNERVILIKKSLKIERIFGTVKRARCM